MIGGRQDGGGRPAIDLVSSPFSKLGCAHLVGPLVSAREVVLAAFLWIQ